MMNLHGEFAVLALYAESISYPYMKAIWTMQGYKAKCFGSRTSSSSSSFSYAQKLLTILRFLLVQTPPMRMPP